MVFVSKDSSQYCIGRFTRRGAKADAEEKLAEAQAKFKANTVWKLTNVQLVKHDKPLYIGCSVKATIDINASKFTPVLQSAEFQVEDHPPETPGVRKPERTRSRSSWAPQPQSESQPQHSG